MAREDISIKTNDGACPTSVFTPSSGAGPWPAIIFVMDGMGIRPVLREMAQRMADWGYVVLLPDLYYRQGPYEALKPAEVFASGRIMEIIMPLLESIDGQRAGDDATAFLAYLDTRADVAGKKVGTHGYCMGGGLALNIAGAHPDRIAAVASFHGGSLATDSHLSPHLAFSKISGFVYIGAADDDPYYDANMAAKVTQALMQHHVAHRHELYKDAAHGWTMADFPIYKKDDSERHFDELRALYDKHLR
jgi:carboxymethylenebutenolidase